MDPEQLIVLYSKYSPQCNRIVDLYQQQRPNIDYLRLLCVDNVNLRESILNATNVRIRTVPCVLFIYPGGRIEKFEGSNVSDWIIRQMSKNAPLPHTPVVPLSQQTEEVLPSTHASPSVLPIPDQSTPLESLVLNDDDESRGDIAPMIRPQSSSTTNKNRSIADIAADMAASRTQIDNTLDMRRMRNS